MGRINMRINGKHQFYIPNLRSCTTRSMGSLRKKRENYEIDKHGDTTK